MRARIVRYAAGITFIAAAGIAHAAGTPTPRRAATPEAEVRAVLAAWQAAIEGKDVDAAASLCAADFRQEEMSDQTGQEAAREVASFYTSGRRGATTIDVSHAVIVVRGTVATAEHVRIGSVRRATYEHRFSFRKEAGGWKIAEIEEGIQVPVELDMPGLGPDYLALADRWAGANLEWAQRTLRANPPQGGDSTLRAFALHRIDEPLHLWSAPQLAAVQAYFRGAIDDAIAGMRAERVTQGATIWKLYNQGWIVRTANHTWGHDIYDGVDRAKMTDEQVDAILGQIDVLFISHWHGDHLSMRVVKRALAKGIPVLLPPVPERARGELAALGPGATVIEQGADGEVRGIRYHAYPGHQDGLPNNCFATTTDGMTILHTGDQRWEADYPWIERIGDERAVDVLLAAIWTIEDGRAVRGVRPRVVIPGHENELGHGFDGRFPYHRDYDIITGPPQQWYVLSWGERVHVDPR